MILKPIYGLQRAHLRARILVVVLLFGLLSELLELILLLLELRLSLESLLILGIDDLALIWDRSAGLHSRAVIDPLPPLLEVRELGKVDTSEIGDIDPAEVGDIGNAVLIADKIVVLGELIIEDTVETFGLTDITLNTGQPVGRADMERSTQTWVGYGMRSFANL